MIVLIDTSSAVCRLTFVNDGLKKAYDWQADRTLAKNLLLFLREKLQENDKTWSDISAIGVFQGPGSFTGLRIGLTVMNTIADSENISIVGATGEAWQDVVLQKLEAGVNEKIIMPIYGSDAHITTPRK